MNDALNGADVNIEQSRGLSLSTVRADLRHSPNRADISFGEFGIEIENAGTLWLLLAASTATLLYGILLVVLRCSSKEVDWSEAWAIIAVVAYFVAFRDWPFDQFVRNAMNAPPVVLSVPGEYPHINRTVATLCAQWPFYAGVCIPWERVVIVLRGIQKIEKQFGTASIGKHTLALLWPWSGASHRANDCGAHFNKQCIIEPVDYSWP